MVRLLSLVMICLALAAPARAETVTVFAAASLRTALDAIAPGFKAETGHNLRLSYAGSSALARQIQLGAPADVFVSANAAWMNVIAAEGLIVEGQRVDIAGNHLSVVGRHDALALTDPTEIQHRLGENGRLAMALVDAVPAGIYGQQALRALGLWSDLSPRVAQADNVRAALALVALGEAPLGITYATDALAEPQVRALYQFAPETHDPIRYPAALLRDTEGARALLRYLQSDGARNVLERQGFSLPPWP